MFYGTIGPLRLKYWLSGLSYLIDDHIIIIFLTQSQTGRSFRFRPRWMNLLTKQPKGERGSDAHLSVQLTKSMTIQSSLLLDSAGNTLNNTEKKITTTLILILNKYDKTIRLAITYGRSNFYNVY